MDLVGVKINHQGMTRRCFVLSFGSDHGIGVLCSGRSPNSLRAQHVDVQKENHGGRRTRPGKRPSASRKGFILTAELLLVLPLVILIVFALLELGLLLHGKQKLATAGHEGVRIAALTGNPEAVHRVVMQVLGLQTADDLALDIITPSGLSESRSGDMIEVVVGLKSKQLSGLALNLLGLGEQMSFVRSVMRRE